MKKISAQIESILNKSQLTKDYDELKSVSAISRKYGISDVAVKTRLKKYDVAYESKIHKYKCDHDLFAEDSERSFYLAGFIAADGCVRISPTNKNKNYINHRIVIALSDKDLRFLEKIRDTIGCENPIHCYQNNLSQRNANWRDGRIVKLSITSKKMVSDLERFSIVPRKTFLLDMPEWLMTHKLVNHFIRGYVDGDGSFYISSAVENNSICFSVRGNIPFLEKVKSILEQNCNFISEAKPRMSSGIGQFAISSNKMVATIADYLYGSATIYLPRKHDIARKASEILAIQHEADIKIRNILGRS